FEAARIEIAEIIAQDLRLRVHKVVAVAGEKFGEIGEVAPVSVERIGTGTLFRGEHVEEQAGELGVRGLGGRFAHALEASSYFLRNLSGGIVTVISRGFGLTKLASANTTP